ncbi:DUF3875 domain-containing protein [Bacteroides thetaiotaomicron]|nr:DUF3875 domain-containing protein [Bacteroides thetaiotaomicron]
MIGIIILISLLICALCLLIALLYIRQTEIEVKDKSVDLESVLPIQTITENAVINGNGDITVGYRLLLPEVFTLSESEAQYIHERLEALLKPASGRHGHPSAEFLLYGAIPSCRILFQCPDSGEQPSFQRQGDTEQLHQPVCDVHERQPKR